MGIGDRISDIIGNSEVDDDELPDKPTVLVIEDEEGLADLYTVWLENGNNVKTAYSGEEGLEMMTEEVDIVLLDRRMPEMSGDEVLEEMRNRGYDCQVAMVTAVDPDVDIVDMAFDHYITKPLERDDVQEAIEKLLERSSLDKNTQKRQTMRLKKAILQNEGNDGQIEDSDEFAKLDRQLEKLERNETSNEEIDDFFG
jgi:DNA-binding response OmpR family regulator